MADLAIVVVACHFAEREELCATTIARLQAAMYCVSHDTSLLTPPIVVTGDVPYEAGSKTLCQLMREYLIAKGFSGAVIMAAGETGSFAEPRIVTRKLKELFPEAKRFLVISSNWQLWVGRPFWKRSASTAGLDVMFLSLANTGGWRTRFFYAAYAVFVRAALATGLWSRLERLLYRKAYATRRDGFQWNGCA